MDEQSEGEEADWEEEDGIAEAIEASQSQSQAVEGSSRGLQVVNEPEGLWTPRAMQPSDAAGDDGDDELARLASNALSLEQTHTRGEVEAEEEVDDHPTQIGDEGGRDIPGMRRYELTPGALMTEAVMTPRNDVGPFVLDGGADRNSTGAAPMARSLDATASGAPSTRATN